MSQWTDSAKTRLEDYFAGVRKTLEGSGADVNEVVEDLRRHVEEEVAASRLGVVTEQDVVQILMRVGAPEAGAAPAGTETGPAVVQSGGAGPARKPPGWALLFFGVVLPLGTIIFELATSACAATLFNPLPSLAHVLLVLTVPLANLLVWLGVRRGAGPWRAALGWANGFALGVASVYALLFVPFSPFALFGVLFYGLGLVPLAPALSLVTAVLLRWHLAWSGGNKSRVPGGWGPALAIAGLAIFTLPMMITQVGLQMALSDSAAESARGVRWLRAFGQEEGLLRACYGWPREAAEVYEWGKPVSPETARAIYYRVTGRPFNAVPPPRLYAGRARWNVPEEESAWDGDLGGDAVAGRVRGLWLRDSRQDGIIDGEGALGYVEWTLEFRNDSGRQREARAQILLPHGAVVSRVTLWVDGEPREAAFGGRSQVKTAYKAVVLARRDPVLVTTCGPDRVLLQCFPVPPNGGSMKVRMG